MMSVTEDAAHWLEHDWFPRPLPANVTLGPRSWLYSSYAFVHYRSQRPKGVRIGRDTGVYIETYFDLDTHGEVSIGDFCTLAGPIISTNGRIRIGNHVLISREVVIGAEPFAAPPKYDAPSPITADIEIGDDAWIGTRAVILPGAHIGQGAIIGAGAVVDFIVPSYAIVAGNPAKVVAWAKPAEPMEKRISA
jgi:acetyltransferase-like isoleucine patch superfamily enzyme